MCDLNQNVNAAHKQEVITAVEENYLYTKKQRYMGFHGVSTKILVDHLMERYEKICASELEAFRKALEDPIDVYRPIKVYFQRVFDTMNFAQDGKMLLTPAQIFEMEYNAVNKTGIYSLALKEWNKKRASDQNWTIFKQVLLKNITTW